MTAHGRWVTGRFHNVRIEGLTPGTAYPVLVNSNLERMDVKITASGIEVKTYDEGGELKHQWSGDKRP